MLKKQSINLSFKDKLEEYSSVHPNQESVGNMEHVTDDATETTYHSRNRWSGYHVRFRNPRNFQEYAIDKQFNRWGDMVEFFKGLEKPYSLSEGSLKDLLYGTYTRRGKHGLSLNDLVEIEKIARTRLTKPKIVSTLEEQTETQVASPINDILEKEIPVPLGL